MKKKALFFDHRTFVFCFVFQSFTTSARFLGPISLKFKIILSLEFKINLIFYFVKKWKKNMFLKFSFEIEGELNMKVTINSI